MILSRQGLLALARLAYQPIAWRIQQWNDASIDRKFGIDTCGINDDLDALGVKSENGSHGHGYEAIQIPVFNRIIKKLPINVREYCFIDYGSGKARALILAAEAGFGRVIGIEFAPVLHAAAQRNIETYQNQRPNTVKFENFCEDATTFNLPHCNSVLFFYNPFDDTVLKKVLLEIERNWNTYQRDLIIAYRNPVYASIFDAAKFLQPLSSDRSFRLYRTKAINRITG
jgi:SAM-dependent methyltransferase